jgi:hypothetical protein
MLAGSAMLRAQNTQLRSWFIAPKKIDMPPGVPPAVIPLSTINGIAPPQTAKVANGMYDSNNNLLFYVSDNGVYDYNNTLIGNFTPVNAGAEVVIVPFGNNNSCQSKFNIFTTSPGFTTAVSLVQTVLDMKSFSMSSTVIDNLPYQNEFGALAVSKPNASGNRYLYFMSATGTPYSSTGAIKKLTVQNNGTVTPNGIIYPTVNNPNYNAGSEVFAKELDLSPDGKFLAWGSFAPTIVTGTTQYRYHILELDVAGNYVNNSYQKFNIPSISGNNVQGFRGVEFYNGINNTKLFIGAGTDGIFSITIPLVNAIPVFSDFTSVTNSSNFGLSQIEQSYNGYMYAASASGFVGAFDPTSSMPIIILGQSFTLTNPLPPNSGWQGSSFYTLPDQIDGQDYSSIATASVPQVVTYNTLNFPANSNTNQNATWIYGSSTTNNPLASSTPIYITKELRVRQNSNLIISAMKFVFSPSAKVIIEQGSTLTLDNGAILTSVFIDNCTAYTWPGVEVWGNSSASQNTLPLAQGKLTVKNASRIEYAQWGARTWDGSLNAASKAGGIINVTTGGKFLNCNVGVEFKPYQNFTSTGLAGNKSSFVSAQFTNNQYYPFAAAPQHVTMDGCTGIAFNNCTFLNHFSQAMFNMLSIGIKSVNANFTAGGNTTFTNLYHGIDAKRTSGTNNFSVTGCTFTDNQTGIYTDNVNAFIVQLNTFKIGKNLKVGATIQLGIRNQFVTGFSIEENNFQLSPNNISTVKKWGIGTYSTGTASNQIYKNTFTGISRGNYAEGVNRSNSNPTLQGLQYLCNTNTGNTEYDFFIYSTGENINEGIRLFQGTHALGAGNLFSTNTNPASNYNNSTGTALNYYYKQPSNPAPINYANVVTQTATTANGCVSICNNCIAEPLTNATVIQLKSDFDAEESAYLNLLYTYNQLMDGGSTNALLNQMQLSWSTDAQVLRDELLALSPYLSQDVLREVADRNILPPAMLLMICMANPDATRGDDFLDYLQYRIADPLPHYMINLIIASWDQKTARTTMEGVLGDYNSDMALISNKLLQDLYLKQSLDPDSLNLGNSINLTYEITNWLIRIQTLEAKYDLIENYFSSGEFENAEHVIENIPIDFKLTEDQQNQYNDYVFFYQFRKTLADQESNLSLLDSLQIETLVNFTQGDYNFAKGLAQNALCFYYDLCREDQYECGGSNRIKQSINAPSSIAANEVNHTCDASVFVSPNPVSGVAAFSYSIPSFKDYPVLSISDITGKSIQSFTIKNHQGKLMWDTGSLKSGLYSYTVKENNSTIAKGKISIKR